MSSGLYALVVVCVAELSVVAGTSVGLGDCVGGNGVLVGTLVAVGGTGVKVGMSVSVRSIGGSVSVGGTTIPIDSTRATASGLAGGLLE